MPFIIAKTVTYVSSLTVTYVTTLYIVSSRAVQTHNNESDWANSYCAGRGIIQPNTQDPEQKREAESLPYNGYGLHAIQPSARFRYVAGGW